MDDKKQLETTYRKMLFGVRRSIRYHSRREGFYRGCHALVMLIIALMFSVVPVVKFLNPGNSSWIVAIMASLVKCIRAFNSVFRFSEKAHQHADFVHQFTDLEIQLSNNELNEDLIRSVRKKRLEIEAKEPPIKDVLDTLCHNELLRAIGYPRKDQIKVSFLQRLLSHICDINADNLHKENHTPAS